MHVHQEIQRQPGPEVSFHCPACYLRNVPAATYDQQIREKLYGLIPVSNLHSTWVVCSNCKTPLRSRATAAELEGLDADQLAELIYADAGFVPKVMALIALLIAILPGIGTVFAALALFVNRKFPCWSRTLSWVALGISFIPIAIFGVGMILALAGVIK